MYIYIYIYIYIYMGQVRDSPPLPPMGAPHPPVGVGWVLSLGSQGLCQGRSQDQSLCQSQAQTQAHARSVTKIKEYG